MLSLCNCEGFGGFDEVSGAFGEKSGESYEILGALL